ncbi:amino acid ABC transporter substrate-binding protein [Methanoculleus sp. FWC-SCC1]|uniref:Amino acid ABC transporter substrate-binding protein n=1 Tax=Methanoculleus frigidifontis TaxID=2584085 RepID=A0ABT8M8K1_9EURY|nr:amino acid ABC transporter substrate-binding protein [Methanoculleus sp. FWC-SCC1]
MRFESLGRDFPGFLTLIILATVVFACRCTGTTTTPRAGEQENVIGILLPLTGDYTEAGQASNAALEVAAEDINRYFASIGSDYQVRLVVEDTETEPAVALEKLKKLDAQGVTMVIGPVSSAERRFGVTRTSTGSSSSAP